MAAGRAPADLVLKNATYVNVFSNELCHGDIAVAEGLIVGMGEYHGKVEVDVSGKLVLPGFIDAHIHLESSLVSPTEFAKPFPVAMSRASSQQERFQSHRTSTNALSATDT